MIHTFPKPIKSHIADVYDIYHKIIVYDANSIDTKTNMFKTLYLNYGTLDSEDDMDIVYLQSIGCKKPALYNPDKASIIEIGGTW